MYVAKLERKYTISCDSILFIIYILSLCDYLLTYIGINMVGIISEANPLMVSFMALPLYKGLLLRMIISLIPILLFKGIEKYFSDHNSYKNIILLVLLIQVYPYSLHLQWVYYYLKYYLTI